jgi:transposase
VQSTKAKAVRARRAREFRKALVALGAYCIAASPSVPPPLPSIYVSHDDETKRQAITEVFACGKKSRGAARAVANKYGLSEKTLSNWVRRHDDAASAIARHCGARPGRHTVLPKEVEDAVAKLVVKCWQQNRTLCREAVVCIATDAAEKHGVVWQVRWDRFLANQLFCTFWTGLTGGLRAQNKHGCASPDWLEGFCQRYGLNPHRLVSEKALHRQVHRPSTPQFPRPCAPPACAAAAFALQMN